MLSGRGTSSRDDKLKPPSRLLDTTDAGAWGTRLQTGKPERSTMQSVHHINVFPFTLVHCVPAPIMLNAYK